MYMYMYTSRIIHTEVLHREIGATHSKRNINSSSSSLTESVKTK